MARRQATIEFEAVEFPSAQEAIQHSFASRQGESISPARWWCRRFTNAGGMELVFSIVE